MPTENKLTPSLPEVKRWQLKGFIPGIEGESKAVFRPVVVLADDFDRIAAERDALQRRLNAADQRIDELTIPDGYCVMPTRLTAENGAKALLLGEFKLKVTTECPECRELEEPLEGCELCDGEGEYGQQHMIPWDKIKFIYSEAVKGLAKNPPRCNSLPLQSQPL